METKKQIVDLHNCGKSVSELSRDYEIEIGQSTISRWVKRINITGSTKEKR